MHLFVEAEFLLDFEKADYPDNRTVGQERFSQIFKEYTHLKLYLDSVEKIIDQSKLFDLVTNNNPGFTIIGSFKDYFQQGTDFPEQTLIFTKDDLPNCDHLERLGLLCFTWDSYERKIKKIMDQIHVEYLLAEGEFTQWDLLSSFSILPIKKVIIEDPYIFCDKKKQKIEKNLIPLLESLLVNPQGKSAVYIFTNEVKDYHEKYIPELHCVQRRYEILKRKLSKQLNELYILESNLSKSEYDQHDRYVYLAYAIISVGKGFNLFPARKSNSSVKCSTIFNKAAYRKLTSHINNLTEVTDNILRKKYQNAKFNMFPETDKINLF